jgi:hypothetical protein
MSKNNRVQIGIGFKVSQKQNVHDPLSEADVKRMYQNYAGDYVPTPESKKYIMEFLWDVFVTDARYFKIGEAGRGKLYLNYRAIADDLERAYAAESNPIVSPSNPPA